jgi:hypothetical protein
MPEKVYEFRKLIAAVKEQIASAVGFYNSA